MGTGLAALAVTFAVAAPAFGDDTGFEICTVAANCQKGANGVRGGEFVFPLGVAVDTAGNVYVADADNQRIQKFDSAGSWERAWGKDVVAGGGTGFEVCTIAATCKEGVAGQLGGELNEPTDVATDAAGNVYVMDSYNERIQKFDSFGNFKRAWGKDVDSAGGTGFEVCTVAASCREGALGSLGGEFYGLGFFGGLTTDLAGNVYVAEEGLNNRVQKFDSAGNWERAWGKDVVTGGGTGFEICTVATSCKDGEIGGLGGEFDIPSGMAADGSGNVYVTDIDRVEKFDSSGNFQLTWGMDVDTGGGTGLEVCMAAANCKRGEHGVLGGELDSPLGLGTDTAGNVYVVDGYNNRIQSFDAFGSWERAWGQDVVTGGDIGYEVCTVAASCKRATDGGLGGQLSRNAVDAAADAEGNVYVSDSGNARIQKFDSAGKWERAWGRNVVAQANPVEGPLCAGIRATIVGTNRADVLHGSARKDVIVSLGGGDNISALAGKDLVCGGTGNDTIKGGGGNDRLYGQQGDDKLIGQAGNDSLRGGDGKDRLRGGAGKDRRVQ